MGKANPVMLKNETHSFIVRVWTEPREIQGEPVILRGMIEHVKGGEKMYFKDFDEMIAFISKVGKLDVNRK